MGMACYILSLDELVVVVGMAGEADFEVGRVRGLRKGLVLVESLGDGTILQCNPSDIIDGGEEEEEKEEEGMGKGELGEAMEDPDDGDQGEEGGEEMDGDDEDDFVSFIQQQQQQQHCPPPPPTSPLLGMYLASDMDTARTAEMINAAHPETHRAVAFVLRSMAALSAVPPSIDYLAALGVLLTLLTRKSPLHADRFARCLQRESERR